METRHLDWILTGPSFAVHLHLGDTFLCGRGGGGSQLGHGDRDSGTLGIYVLQFKQKTGETFFNFIKQFKRGRGEGSPIRRYKRLL
jgi:hypothetical protein